MSLLLTVYQSVCMPVCPSMSISVCGSIYLMPACLSVSLFVRMSCLYVSVCPSYCYYFSFPLSSDNMGATHLNVSKINFRKYAMTPVTNLSVLVDTICVDDLIPLVKTKKIFLKMDIERAEALALSCAHKFFAQLDVQFVLMEWVAKRSKDRKFITKFLGDFGFTASKLALKYRFVFTKYGRVHDDHLFFIKNTSASFDNYYIQIV